MSRKKISTTVYITPEQNERLHLLHTRTKVPVAVYIREGIDLVLTRYEHALPGQMSLTEASKRSAATRGEQGGGEGVRRPAAASSKTEA
jgi:hypothetical protein